MLIVEKSAPSNIALIKYMGKIDESSNLPTNSSLSWTLNNLRSYVRLTLDPGLKQDQWQSLAGFDQIELSEKGKTKFLNHLKRVKDHFGVTESILIESANDFPSDCGLASSASSFAALTMAAVELCEKLKDKFGETSFVDQAEISRNGSGSSCRSFFGPWALWYQEGVRPLEFPVANLKHQVIVVASGHKEVSSSEAHRRVVSSSYFQGRPQRAEQRLAYLMEALRSAEWDDIYRICWDEFEDMHQLFETSKPAFSYKKNETFEVLKFAKDLWLEQKDGPLVTMDAGANVHLLYRPDQSALIKKVHQEYSKKYRMVGDVE